MANKPSNASKTNKTNLTSIAALIAAYDKGSDAVRSQNEGLERVKGVASQLAANVAKAVGIDPHKKDSLGGTQKQAMAIEEPTFKAWFAAMNQGSKGAFCRRVEVGVGYESAKGGGAGKGKAAGSLESVIAFIAKATAEDLTSIGTAMQDRRVALAAASEKKAAKATALPVLPAPAVGVDPGLVAQILAALGAGTVKA